MWALSVRRRVHFRRAERHDRFGGGQKPPRKVLRLEDLFALDERVFFSFPLLQRTCVRVEFNGTLKFFSCEKNGSARRSYEGPKENKLSAYQNTSRARSRFYHWKCVRVEFYWTLKLAMECLAL